MQIMRCFLLAILATLLVGTASAQRYYIPAFGTESSWCDPSEQEEYPSAQLSVPLYLNVEVARRISSFEMDIPIDTSYVRDVWFQRSGGIFEDMVVSYGKGYPPLHKIAGAIAEEILLEPQIAYLLGCFLIELASELPSDSLIFQVERMIFGEDDLDRVRQKLLPAVDLIPLLAGGGDEVEDDSTGGVPLLPSPLIIQHISAHEVSFSWEPSPLLLIKIEQLADGRFKATLTRMEE